MDSQAFDLLMERLKDIEKRINDVDAKADVLIGFRAWAMGAAAAISAVVSFLSSLVSHK